MRDVYIPIKKDVSIENGFPINLSKEEKLKLLWLELDVIDKKFELI